MDLAQLNLSTWISSLVAGQGEVLRFLLASRGLEVATQWAAGANAATAFEGELDQQPEGIGFFPEPAPEIGPASLGMEAFHATLSQLQLPTELENELLNFPLLRLVLESDRPLTRIAPSVADWDRSVRMAAEFGATWVEALPDLTDSARLADALSAQWPRWQHQLLKGKLSR